MFSKDFKSKVFNVGNNNEGVIFIVCILKYLFLLVILYLSINVLLYIFPALFRLN